MITKTKFGVAGIPKETSYRALGSAIRADKESGRLCNSSILSEENRFSDEKNCFLLFFTRGGLDSPGWSSRFPFFEWKYLLDGELATGRATCLGSRNILPGNGSNVVGKAKARPSEGVLEDKCVGGQSNMQISERKKLSIGIAEII
ncbi:hypothetical protein JTB14_000477 [Gonioctena quinquepunctata]|nr:hypothetical protein JTB14_000477 [Gonioctena quinquepunctata]